MPRVIHFPPVLAEGEEGRYIIADPAQYMYMERNKSTEDLARFVKDRTGELILITRQEVNFIVWRRDGGVEGGVHLFCDWLALEFCPCACAGECSRRIYSSALLREFSSCGFFPHPIVLVLVLACIQLVVVMVACCCCS